MYFALAQILFALWAILFAHFQVPCIKAMRDYVPLGNPHTKPFHNRGMLLSSLVAAFLIALLFGTCGWKEALFSVVSFISIYKILFDGIIGKEVYGDFYYVGTTAKQDAWINKHFPHDRPGEIKSAICLILFLFTNITNYLV